MPEAPLISAGEPDRMPPLFSPVPDDVPPALTMPPVPTNDLRPLVDNEDADQLVGAVATGKFAAANPQYHQWALRRPGAEARRAAFAGQSARLAQLQLRTAFFKTVAAGKEPDFKRSLYSALQQMALCVLSVGTLGSALNVAANYAIESGAWSALITDDQHQQQWWVAALFVFVAPVGGLAGILGLAQTLETDQAGKRLEQIVAALTLTAWTAWLVAFGLLYGLHSELGDAGGRALPAEAMNELRYLHTWMLVLQITAEVLSGAAFKLLWSRIHWQNTKVEVVPSPDLAFMQKESDRFYEAESRTADFVGRIDDYHANYRNGLAAYTVACEAELRRLKNGARAAEAAARAAFLAAGHAPAASHETEEIEA